MVVMLFIMMILVVIPSDWQVRANSINLLHVSELSPILLFKKCNEGIFEWKIKYAFHL